MKSSDLPGRPVSFGIGALAARFGLAPHVLRHWEAKGLLVPARDTAGRRRYGADDLTRVAVVLRAKQAGLPLDAIRALVADPAGRVDVLRAQAEGLRARIAAAQAALEVVECALGCDHEDGTRCPHALGLPPDSAARSRSDRFGAK